MEVIALACQQWTSVTSGMLVKQNRQAAERILKKEKPAKKEKETWKANQELSLPNSAQSPLRSLPLLPSEPILACRS